MSNYFDRFPLTDYNNEVMRNILTKVDLSEQSKRDIYAYYEYTLEEGLTRPDQLSNNYYGSPDYHWIFYLVNNVVDPYYSFYLDQDAFAGYIAKKYGSEEAAREQIVFYRNNWYMLEDSQISTTTYDALSPELQKYYRPVLNNTLQAVGYKRINQDWTRSTNAIIELTVNSVEGYAIGDRIAQSTTASGTIRSIDSVDNILTVQHISGSFVEGAIDDTSITNVNEIYRGITLAESAFWVPVTAYEYEEEENEKKKNIFVLPNTYLAKFDSEFKEKISQ